MLLGQRLSTGRNPYIVYLHKVLDKGPLSIYHLSRVSHPFPPHILAYFLKGVRTTTSLLASDVGISAPLVAFFGVGGEEETSNTWKKEKVGTAADEAAVLWSPPKKKEKWEKMGKKRRLVDFSKKNLSSSLLFSLSLSLSLSIDSRPNCAV